MNKLTAKSMGWIVAMGAIFVSLALLLWFHQDAVRSFLDFVRDRRAVIAYLDALGIIGPLVLMGLVGLQVLIPSLPAEPLMIAGGYAYGFTAGFLMNWMVSVAVSQAVFSLARHAGRPVVERLVPADLLDRRTRTASEKGAMFFLLAFVIPPVPSDILIYVAGLGTITGRRFFVANLFGRMPMVVLLTLVGAYGFRVTPGMIVGVTAVGIVLLVAWLSYVREGPEAQASRDPRLSPYLEDGSLLAPYGTGFPSLMATCRSSRRDEGATQSFHRSGLNRRALSRAFHYDLHAGSMAES